MRATDFGCGDGTISLLLSDAVGKAGRVDGVDINQKAIAAAQKNMKDAGKTNANFSVADINGLDTGKYDAVFGRGILMYQENPLETVKRLKNC